LKLLSSFPAGGVSCRFAALAPVFFAEFILFFNHLKVLCKYFGI